MDRALFVILCLFVINSDTKINITCSFETNFCGWKQTNWERKTKSDFTSVGPQRANHGYWFIITDVTHQAESILTIDFQKPADPSCLKFRSQIQGSNYIHLDYGYYNDLSDLKVISTLDRNGDFWKCSTFSFSNVSTSATGLYFKARNDQSSANIKFVSLDNLLLVNGTQCSDIDCPQGPIITTQPMTTPMQGTTLKNEEDDSKNTLYIASGAGGAVILLVVVVAVYCVVKRKCRGNMGRKKWGTNGDFNDEGVPSIAEAFHQLRESRTQGNANRPLPNVPNPAGDYEELGPSTDTKHSAPPLHKPNGYIPSVDINQDQLPANISNGGTNVHLPLDYTINNWNEDRIRESLDNNEEEVRIRENFAKVQFDPKYRNTTDSCLTPAGLLRPDQSNVTLTVGVRISDALSDISDIPFNQKYENVTDDDYLCPVRATDNHYESDPTDKNATNTGRRCTTPSDIPTFRAPDIPTDIGASKSDESNYDGEDYEDAMLATQTDQSSDESDREVKGVTDNGDKRDSDTDDYLTVDNKDTDADNGDKIDSDTDDYLTVDNKDTDADNGDKRDSDTDDYLTVDNKDTDADNGDKRDSDTDDYLNVDNKDTDANNGDKSDSDTDDYLTVDNKDTDVDNSDKRDSDNDDYLNVDNKDTDADYGDKSDSDTDDYLTVDNKDTEADNDDKLREGDYDNFLRVKIRDTDDDDDYLYPSSDM